MKKRSTNTSGKATTSRQSQRQVALLEVLNARLEVIVRTDPLRDLVDDLISWKYTEADLCLAAPGLSSRFPEPLLTKLYNTFRDVKLQLHKGRAAAPRERPKSRVQRFNVGGRIWGVAYTGTTAPVFIKDPWGKKHIARDMDHLLRRFCAALNALEEYREARKKAMAGRIAEANRDALPMAATDWFGKQHLWAIFDRKIPATVLAKAKTVAGLRKSAQARCDRTGETLRFVWQNDGQVETITPRKKVP